MDELWRRERGGKSREACCWPRKGRTLSESAPRASLLKTHGLSERGLHRDGTRAAATAAEAAISAAGLSSGPSEVEEAAAQGLADPQQVNRAMLAELDALRATRLTEVAQMDEILAELAPLIEEVREDA